MLLAGFALTGYAVTPLLGDTTTLLAITLWFVAAAVVWTSCSGRH